MASILIPSPEWSRNSIDISLDGILAYGSTNVIVLFDVKFSPVLTRIVKAFGYKFYIHSVAFCKHTKTKLLAVYTKHSVLKVWDISDVPKCVICISGIPGEGVVEWQRGSDDYLFFSHKCAISRLNVTNHEIKTITFNHIDNTRITDVASSPVDPVLLSIGFSNGAITIMSTLDFQTIYNLESHYTEITSLSWSPFSPSHLFSTSIGGHTCIWTLGNDGPFSSYHHSKKDENAVVVGLWHPLDSDKIVFTDPKAHVCVSDVKEVQSVTYFEADSIRHNRLILALILNNFDPNILCTLSVDHQLIFWDLSKMKSVYVLHTASGAISSLAYSPSKTLAIGCGDGIIRLWQTTSSSENGHCVSYVYPRRRGQVTVIAWHPKIKSVFGYGTKEGRVGYVEGRRCSNCISKHSHAVYNLSWGPFYHVKDDRKKANLHLFSCAGGKLYIHPLDNPDEEQSINFDSLPCSSDEQQANSRSGVGWKPDLTMLAVGNRDGTIEIYDHKLTRMIAKLLGPTKAVIRLTWHPSYTPMSTEKSLFHCWLAVASYESSLLVYDLSQVAANKGDDPLVIHHSTHTIRSYSGKVFGIIWNPHIDGQLASAFYDKTMKVWDVMSAQVIATSKKCHERIFSFEWSIHDHDVIYHSSENSHLVAWKISQQIPAEDERNSVDDSVKLSFLNDNQPVESSSNNDCFDVCNGSKIRENTSASHDTAMEEEPLPRSAEVSKIKKAKKTEKPKTQLPGASGRHNRRRDVQLFPYFTKFVSHGEAPVLEQYPDFIDNICADKGYQPKDTGEDNLLYGMFGNRNSLLQLMGREAKECGEDPDFMLQYHLCKGTLNEALEEAANTEKLTDLHLAFAPAVSGELYFNLCEKYSNQLRNQKNYFKAALYLLACHKIYETIDLINATIGPKHAYALAKSRLPKSDPIIPKILEEWKNKLMQSGAFELPSICVLAEEDPLAAASVLSGKKEPLALKVAAYICVTYGYLDEAKKYFLDCLKLSLMSEEWHIAKELVSEHPKMKGFEVVVAIHEYLLSHIEIYSTTPEQWGLVSQVITENPPEDLLYVWKSYTTDGRSFLHQLFTSIQSQGLLQPHSDFFAFTFDELKHLLDKTTTPPQTTIESQYFMAVNIATFFFSLFDDGTTVDHRLTALKYINNVFFFNILDKHLEGIASLFLLPFDLIWSPHEHQLRMEPIGRGESSDELSELFHWMLEQMNDSLKRSGINSSLSDSVTMDEVQSMLLACTVVPSISAHFFMNLAHQLRLQLSGIQLYVPDVDSVSGSIVSDDLVGSSSSGVPKLETLHELQESGDSEKVSFVNSSSTEDSCSTEVRNDDDIPSVECPKVDSKSLQKKVCLWECNAQLGPNDNFHDSCNKLMCLFQQVTVAISNAACNDAFGVMYLLRKEKSIALKTNDLLKKDLETLSEINLQNEKEAASKEASEESKILEPNRIVPKWFAELELQDSELTDLIERFADKVYRYPNSLAVISVMEQIFDEVQRLISCSSAIHELATVLDSVKQWAFKFEKD